MLENNWFKNYKTKGLTRSLAARTLIVTLLVGMISFISPVISPESSDAVVLPECSPSATSGTVTGGGTITIKPTHGKAFYIDSGQGQNIDASYVGYKIKSSTTRTDLWVQLDGFENDAIQLVNSADSAMQIGALTTQTNTDFLGNAYQGTAYFLLKASAPTSVAQIHNVNVYEGNPNKAGNTALYSCQFTFQKVRETIKAAANKVVSVSSTAISQIGDVLTVTHTGQTGTIGAGSLPDSDIIWLSPASNSSWPTRALKLTKVVATYYQNKNRSGTDKVLTDELILNPAKEGVATNKDPGSYIAVYTFKVIGRAKATIAPVAQISSGTQIKHTDMGGFYSSGTPLYPLDTTATTVNATATKTGAGTSNIVVSGSNISMGYKIAVTNNGSASITIDDIVDTASSSLSFSAGSAKTGAAFPGTTAVADPVSSDVLLANGSVDTTKKNFTFIGPFVVAAGATLTLNYKMLAPCVTGDYTNSAVARVGDTKIGVSSSTLSQVATSLTASSSGTCTASGTQADTTVTQPIEVVTQPATALTAASPTVATSTATINGTVDSNGTSGSAITCEYSTEASLAGSTSVAATTPANGLTTTSNDPIAVACDISGLQPATTYYFRVVAGGIGGSILSFTTPPATATAPTAVTTSASSITTTTATLNSVVNAKGISTTVTYQLAAAASATTCPSDGTAVSITEANLGLNDLDVAVPLVIEGGFDTAIAFDKTGLTNNSSYCYRVIATYLNSSSVSTNVVGGWVLFKASSVNPPTLVTNAATSIDGSALTAVLNGSVLKGTQTVSVKFCATPTEPTTYAITCSSPTVATASPSSVSGTSETAVTATVSGLSAGTKYWFQIIATDSLSPANVTYGNIENFTVPGKPIATTSAASSITTVSSTINGSVSANGAATTIYFCYIADGVGYDSNSDLYLDKCATGTPVSDFTATTAPTVTSTLAFDQTTTRSANLTGLTPSTTYRFQILAKSANGVAKGEILTFTTLSVPTVSTSAASSVQATTATLNGSTTSRTEAISSITYCLSTTGDTGAGTIGSCLTGKGTLSHSSLAINTTQALSVPATGLTFNTTYYYRMTIVAGGITYDSNVTTFTTGTTGVSAATAAATSITTTTATLNGSSSAGSYATTAKFCISTSSAATAGIMDACSSSDATLVGSTSISADASATPSHGATGLTPNTTYYFQVVAIPNTGARAYGTVLSFTTLAVPTVSTTSASSILTTSATLNGTTTSRTEAVSSITYCLSLTGDTGAGTIGSCLTGKGTLSHSSLAINATQALNVPATGLTANTVYYYRMIIVAGGNTYNSNVTTFTTAAVGATATTVAASSKTTTSATLNGSSSAGTYATTTYFCISTSATAPSGIMSACSSDASLVESAAIAAEGSATPSYSATGLSPNTTYYFQLVAIPGTGARAYGSVLNFTTLAAPTVATSDATSVLATSATLNGTTTSTDENISSITYCLSTSNAFSSCLGTATISHSSLLAGRTQALTVSATGLTSNTTYFYRMTVVAAGNTYHSNTTSFTTPVVLTTATTSAASSITKTGATLNGTVSAGTYATDVRFCISTSNAVDANGGLTHCTLTTANLKGTQNLSANTSATSVLYASTTLTTGTTYYFQVLSIPGTGSTVYGAVYDFRTLENPSATTSAATSVSNTSASINGSVSANGTATDVYFCYVAYSASTDLNSDGYLDKCFEGGVNFFDTTAPTVATQLTVNETANRTANLTGLTASTRYLFQILAKSTTGIAKGSILEFTTSSAAVPTITSSAASSLGTSTATLNGSATAQLDGISSITYCIATVEAMTSCTTPTGTQSHSTVSASTTQAVTLSATGLTPGTTYYYHITIVANGVSYTSNVTSFTTSIVLTTASTVAASSVTTTGATLNGSAAAGSYGIDTKFCISTSDATEASGLMTECVGTPSSTHLKVSSSYTAGNSGSPLYAATTLTPATKYYFQIISIPSTGSTVYGTVLNFTTLSVPTVSSSAASSVGSTTATLNGTTTSTSEALSSISYCLSTTGSTAGAGTVGSCEDKGTISLSTLAAGVSGQALTVSTTGLTAGVTYYYRIIIVAGGVTYNSNVTSFTTGITDPSASTSAATSITGTTATLNSSASAGTYAITAKFCLSTSSAATAGVMNHCSASDATLVGSASVSANASATPSHSATSLSPNTTYYFQVVAIPVPGSKVYGSILNFTTLGLAPTTTTNAASSVSSATATLNGSTNPNGQSTTVTFCLSTSSAVNGAGELTACVTDPTLKLTPTTGGTLTGSSSLPSTHAATGLTPLTTYYFQILATNATGSTVGTVQNFRTSNAGGGGAGGGGGGGGGKPTPTPTPTATPTPTPTPTSTPTPTPKNTPTPKASATPTPTPRVTEEATPTPSPTPSPTPPRNSPNLPPKADTKKNDEVANILNGAVENIAPSQTPTTGPSSSSSTSPNTGPTTSPSTPTIDRGERTINELLDETNEGFKPSAGLRIQIIGSRITGQFILSGSNVSDALTVAEAIKESTARTQTEFASIDDVTPIPEPNENQIFNGELTDSDLSIFEASGLDEPTSLASLEIDPDTKWLRFEASAETYAPGSIVYLVVTSSPIVFAQAIVDRYGKAQLTGSLPLSVLESGGHAVRIVGIRSFDGVTSDANGEIVLSDQAIEQIQLFDEGSKATIIISGEAATGSTLTLVREVPLDKNVPWWTIWFDLVVGLFAIAVRFYTRKKRKVSSRRKTSSIVLALIGGIPAVVLGWLTVSYDVLFLGLAIALVFAGLLFFTSFFSKRAKQENASRHSSE